MNIDEAYKCPNCGKQEVNIDGMEQIFEDARSEVAVCRHCNAAWRVYYKMADINTKILHMPEPAPEDAEGVVEGEPHEDEAPAVDPIDTAVDEVTANHIVNDDGIKPGI